MLDSPPTNRPGPTAQVISDADYNIDLRNGPIGVFQDMFPGTNILATSNELFDASPAQNNVSAPSFVAGPPHNTDTSNPFLNQIPLPEASQLSWEEWDQVIRDFQMDVENEDSQPASGTNVSEWFV